MGTSVRVVLTGSFPSPVAADERAFRAVRRVFAASERRLSRFLTDSELSRLNASRLAAASVRGDPIRVSSILGTILREALRVAEETDGAFDPTILPALEAAGYTRSFERLASGRRADGPLEPRFPRGCSWRDVALRRDGHGYAVSLPLGCRIDLGGIGKGWTVDRAARCLRRAGLAAFAVDAGGDLYAAGTAAGGAPWTVGVEDPRDVSRDLMVLAVRDGAVATSTTAIRRWKLGSRAMHHLIDPLTGSPAASGVAAATVVAPSAARADALAKAALIRGPRAGLELLERLPDTEGVLVLDGGRLLLTRGLRRAAA